MKLSYSQQKRLFTTYGPWAVVTGASSGIGKALAEQLAQSGFNLLINGRNVKALEGLKADLTKDHDINIRILVADLGKEEGREALKEASQDLEIGLFMMSAGFGTSGLFLEASIEEEQAMLRVNVEALMELTHHFSKRFVANKKGGIILMSSMVAFQGVPYSANYAASKAYVQSFAEALARELKPHGVDVLAAAPGPVRSGFESRANMQMGMFMLPEQVAAPILKALGRKTTVLPGFLTKFLVYSLRTVPRWGKVRIMQQVMSGMTQHQRA